MSSETTENPVMLWGDMGPDVYKLSQIYDPRNDKYVATQDTSVREGKDYYERRSLILTSDENVHTGRKYYTRNVDADGKVSFVYIDNISEKIHEIDPSKNIYTFNPSQNDWYQDSGGKIIEVKRHTPDWYYEVLNNPTYIPDGIHKSEYEWIRPLHCLKDEYYFEIDNNGTMDELFEKINDIYEKL